MHLPPLQLTVRHCVNLFTPHHLPIRLRGSVHPSSISFTLFQFHSSSPYSTSCFCRLESRENDDKTQSSCLTVSQTSSELFENPVEKHAIPSDATTRETKKALEIPETMWFTEARAALGQRLNVQGILTSVQVYISEPHLALPHVRVPDIRYIDWEELRRHGFKGVVFDKDNTITSPYSLTIWDPLAESIAECKSSFGDEIAVFSNSAGLEQYDHDGKKAEMLESALGIRVIRHKSKKPSGTCEELEKHFICKSNNLVMVGDRSFTDIVYGNRNGLFTILTEPFCVEEEPFVVRQVRKLESSLLNYWFGRGLKPTPHGLVADPKRVAKDFPCS